MASGPQPDQAFDLSQNGDGAHRPGSDEGRFRRLVEGVEQQYVLYGNDIEGRLTYVSPSVKAVLGYEPTDLVGRDWRDLVPCPESRASAERHQAMAFSGLQVPPNLVEVNHADGGRRLLEILPTAVRDDSGEVIGVEGICKDVTELKQTERELVRLTEELDQRVKQRTAELERRLEFEDLLVALSTGFINLPVEEIDAGLQEALHRIGEFIGVDRCFMYRLDDDGAHASLTHEWVRPGVASVKAQMQGIPTADFAWELEQLVTHRVINAPDIEAMPAEAASLQAVYRKLGVRSAVIVPMLSGGRLIGLLGFVSVHQTRQWPAEDVDLVQVLAEVLVNTLDRHRAEAAVRDSELRYRAIVEDQTDMIVRWLPDGTQTFVSDAVCRLHDKPVDQVLGMSVFEGIHPDDVAGVRAKFASLTPERPHAVDEHRVLRADGSVVWMQWIDRALFDAGGQVVEYQSIGRDITELRQTQENLQARLAFEGLLLDISARFISIPTGGIDEVIVDALEQIGRFTGVDRSYVYLLEDPSKPPIEGRAKLTHYWSSANALPVHPSARDIELRDFPWVVRLLEQGAPVHVPSTDTLAEDSPDLKERFEQRGIKSSVNVPMIVDGRLIGYLGFSMYAKPKQWSDDDISLLRLAGGVLVNFLLREQAERELRLSEERLRMTVETVEEGLFDWDIVRDVLFVSDHTLTEYKLPEGENHRDAGRWRALLHPLDRPRVEEALDRHLRGETPFYETEYRLEKPDGEYGWRHARGRVVEWSDGGKPTRMLGVDRDITSRVEQQQKTRDLEEQLAHLGRVATMGETVAGIAHEVNQPLHAASTYSAALRRALESGRPDAMAKGCDLAQKIGEQVARAGDIIRRLREFTRPQPATLRPVDIAAVIGESAALLGHVSHQSAVRCDLQLDQDLPPVQGDAVQLQQVIVNLLQNAYDALRGATIAAPCIRVEAKWEGGSIVVSVADNGPPSGVSHTEELFDPFFTTKPGGMGIGLSLCRTIVQAHHGTIDAENNAGGGMTFSVRLPVARENPV